MPIQRFNSALKKLQKLAKNPEIDIWTMDEVHFQQHGSRARMWIPPEQRDPIVFHYPTRKSVGYYGAIRIRDGKFIWQQERNRFCGDSFLAFLKDLYRVAVRSGRKVILVADNARYHHAKSINPWLRKVSKHLIIEFLPPYSPELNPTERIWKLARRKATHNCYFPSLDDLSLSVERVFDLWKRGNDTLRKLCAIY